VALPGLPESTGAASEGQEPEDRGQGRHEDGPEPQPGRFDRGLPDGEAFLAALDVQVVHQHDRVVHHDPDQHHEAHDALHVERGAREHERRHHTDQGERYAEHHDQGIEEAFELARHHHVDEGEGHHDGDDEIAPRLLLLLVRSAEHDRESVRKLQACELCPDAVHRVPQGHPTLEVGRDVGDALAVHVADLGRPTAALPLHEGGDRHHLAGRRAHGDGIQVLHGEAVLGAKAHGHGVLFPALPEVPGPAAAHVRLDGASHLLHRETELVDTVAVEADRQRVRQHQQTEIEVAPICREL